MIKDEDDDIDTLSISDGSLYFADIGDNTDDFYRMLRDLRDLEGTIEVRYKVSSNGSAGSYRNNIWFFLDDDYDNEHTFQLLHYFSNTTSYAEYIYFDVDGAIKTYYGHDLYIDEWLTIKIEYSLLTSDYRIRGYFDNGTKIMDYEWHDMATTSPGLFEKRTVNFRIDMRSYTDGQKSEIWIDYVNAPFKEREWNQYDTPSDADWLYDNYDGYVIQDNIDDSSGWELVIPRLDAFAGTYWVYCDNQDSMDATDNMDAYIYLYAVDADDGDLHQALGFSAQWDPNNNYLTWYYYVDGVTKAGYSVSIVGESEGEIDFTFALTEDRSKATLKATHSVDGANDRTVYFEVDISDVATDPSQEFVLRHVIDADFDGDVYHEGQFKQISITQRDIFQDIGSWLGGLVDGGLTFINDIFAIIFRWLGQVFTDLIAWLGTVIEDALDALEVALEAAIGLVETAITTMQTALESAIGLVEDAVDGLITFIQEVGADVIEYLIDVAGDVLDAMFAALELLVDALADVVFAIWDATINIDVLAIIDEGLSTVGDMLTKAPAWVLWGINMFNTVGFAYFFILPVFQGANIEGFIDHMISNMSFDVTFGFSFAGFGLKIPAFAVWIYFMLLGLLAGTVFAGFA